MSLRIPAHLKASAARWENIGTWLPTVPGTVAEAVDRWRLDLDDPYEPGGQTAWVAPARRADGTDVVLKVGCKHEEALHEAEGLRAWAGSGAARLYESYETDTTAVMLLERCVPGTPLESAATEAEQDEVIAGLLRRLWIAPEADHPFRPLSELTAIWALGLDRDYAEDPDAMDIGLVEEARGIYRDLYRPDRGDVLLATDLHASNVLAAEREPWLVVDPKPFVGDPAYDAVQHLLNCPDRVAADPFGVTDRFAALLGVDAARVRLWLFARATQEAVGSALYPEWRAKLTIIARAIAPI